MGMVQDRSHVFIVTYGRSGSTLLMGLLNSIPGYCIRGENYGAFIHTYRAFSALRAGKSKFGTQPLESTASWYGADLIQPRVFLRQAAMAFERTVLRPPENCRVTGYKEIRYSTTEVPDLDDYLDSMRIGFDNAKFIFNLRKWEAVSRSGWWTKIDPLEVRATIEAQDRRFESYAARHSDIATLVRYDDYVKQPQSLRALFEFLGETFERETIEEAMQKRHSFA